MKTAIIFGGSGYIGRNLIANVLEEEFFERIYVFDIKDIENQENEVLKYKYVDVREPIAIDINHIDIDKSWIFNFAAIHREPGHKYREYFDTNISGAKNINDFARKTGIKNIFFTSSIAPYGRSLHQRTEESALYPETAYGISKALAERIHREWLAEDASRRLVIVRPSVIFGPKDPGNVYRMIKSIKGGTFILPNGGNIIKAYGYVYGLIDSILFTMKKNERLIIYNYTENPLVSLKEMVSIIKDEFQYKKPIITLSTKLLAFIALFISNSFKLIGKTSDIHPVRVKKAGFPTNIRSQYLIDEGFEFKYDFKRALKHWKSVSPEDFK